jgi:surfeit locus 1 family protein
VSRRNLPFILLCLVAAVVCVRLGVWQLGRLGERRLRNEFVRARLNFPLVDLSALPGDTALVRFRRVQVSGTYDYAHEVVLTARSRNGSPGVNIVTPLRVADRDTAVLVNRGWVYSADASTVDLARWREGDSVTVRGFVYVPDPPPAGTVRSGRHPRAHRWLDRPLLEREAGYPLARVVLVAQGDTAGTGASRIPVRLEPPPLDEGPHWNYAVQWFAFAGIALAGGLAFLTTERRKAATVRGR